MIKLTLNFDDTNVDIDMTDTVKFRADIAANQQRYVSIENSDMNTLSFLNLIPTNHTLDNVVSIALYSDTTLIRTYANIENALYSTSVVGGTLKEILHFDLARG